MNKDALIILLALSTFIGFASLFSPNIVYLIHKSWFVWRKGVEKLEKDAETNKYLVNAKYGMNETVYCILEKKIVACIIKGIVIYVENNKMVVHYIIEIGDVLNNRVSCCKENELFTTKEELLKSLSNESEN